MHEQPEEIHLRRRTNLYNPGGMKHKGELQIAAEW
jgi:hypothetical protein